MFFYNTANKLTSFSPTLFWHSTFHNYPELLRTHVAEVCENTVKHKSYSGIKISGVVIFAFCGNIFLSCPFMSSKPLLTELIEKSANDQVSAE